RKEIPLYRAERTVFGFDHAMVGASLLRQWNLPEPMVEAVACHHELGETKTAPRLKAVTHLANVFANSLNPSLLLYRQSLEPDAQAWEILGLESGSVDEALDDIEKEINEAISAFSLQSGAA
ncbi:MAG TPA: HDOD domain-containing protein, partial [Gammaproteobacteria bacterium]|nr:HDOD domain-containing protein [Gammaproteobacteria bacterium]